MKKLRFNSVPCIVLFVLALPCFSQTTSPLLPLADADSMYVRKFRFENEFRLFYGGQGNNLSLGSARDTKTQLNGDLYQNTNDYLGGGITYGWLNGDYSFSLHGTTYLKEERSNLEQFKLAFSYTLRKLALRLYYAESTGVVISGSDNEFESTPSLHEVKSGIQVMYIFNPSRYSYRASIYQSEYQVRTAGSFLIRFDPFYRKLGRNNGSMIPEAYDLESRFGEQAGLEYIRSFGFLVLPGYGINIAVRDTHFFISPIVFAGLGVAHNTYGARSGTGNFTNIEYAANAVLNAGYNGDWYYTKIQFSWSAGYTYLDPTYLTGANLTCVLTGGIRFANLKKN
ncbi:MAG TPA: DUF4421 family protein [Ohtaekwangia sp.]